MKKYIGTKQVQAKAMNREDYNKLRGWNLPEDENGADAGYLIEYLDGGKPNLDGYDGYVSWSPKEQFDNAYRATTGMNFGLAIEAMKKGLKVARTGWNGKGVWIAYTPGSEFKADFAKEGHAAKHRANELVEFEEEQNIVLLPHFDMRSANGDMVIGWLASQTDMLADDWQIVE